MPFYAIRQLLTAFQDEGIFGDHSRKASLTDNRKFSHTREYTATIDLLRLLHNSLVRIVESWDSFGSGEVQYFEIRNEESLQAKWEDYLASIEKDMTELRFLRRVLSQNIEALNDKRSDVSSFDESGDFKRLTTSVCECLYDGRKSRGYSPRR